ncbi:MAG: DUF1549 domain-containing protein, partial [Verrucomicrobiota bacterium]
MNGVPPPLRPARVLVLCLLAAWAGGGLPFRVVGAPQAASLADAARHWAFLPLSAAPPPRVRAVERVNTPVDAFLLAKLEPLGLGFSPEAERRTWLRRVTHDLTGLPPAEHEVAEFARDARPGARERVVERLLASPRYGERWGRHWLDVARYADTKDLVLLYGRDALRPYAYTYRDYVIR